MKKYVYGCEKTNCAYRCSDGSCNYFLTTGTSRTYLHRNEPGVDINNPCREYAPVERKQSNVSPMCVNRGKTVVQYTLDGRRVREYVSCVVAEKETGISYSSITRCCRGVYSSAGGYFWRYKEDHLCTTSR